mmetsp:Transcript_33947/g.66073  ORF Transcript_33947/g.66073 Transcript_33947/m.66073 type:complete len:602 (-) Transcript_33947:17-1822(-)
MEQLRILRRLRTIAATRRLGGPLHDRKACPLTFACPPNPKRRPTPGISGMATIASTSTPAGGTKNKYTIVRSEQGAGLLKNGELMGADEVELYIQNNFDLADEGDPEAAYRVGETLAFGLGGRERDMSHAAEYFRLAVSNGHRKALILLARYHESLPSNTENNNAKAFELYSAAAGYGMAAGMLNVGRCYEKGHGIAIDEGKALKYYESAAEMGMVKAIYRLSRCYILGIGVEKDLPRGLELMSDTIRVDVMGTDRAPYNMFCPGHGVEKLNRKTCEQVAAYARTVENNVHGGAGEVELLALARCYIHGFTNLALRNIDLNEMPPDAYPLRARLLQDALKLLKAAGTPQATCELANLYLLGFSLPQDGARALNLYASVSDQSAEAAYQVGWLVNNRPDLAQRAGLDISSAALFENCARAAEKGHFRARRWIEAHVSEQIEAIRSHECPDMQLKEARQLYKQIDPFATWPSVLSLLGEMQIDILGDLKQGFELFARAVECDHADKRALVALGKCYEDGVGTEKCGSTAVQKYSEAASLGHVEAWVALASASAKEGDPSRALDALNKAVELGAFGSDRSGQEIHTIQEDLEAWKAQEEELSSA